MEAFDKDGHSICTWSYPIHFAASYFERHLASTPMTLEVRYPAEAVKEGQEITLRSEKVSVAFDASTGMITRVKAGGKEVPFKDGPVAVGMKMRFEEAASYVYQTAEGAVFCAKYKGGVDSIVWKLTSQGLLYMDAVLLNRDSGCDGFDDAFMDTKVYN